MVENGDCQIYQDKTLVPRDRTTVRQHRAIRFTNDRPKTNSWPWPDGIGLGPRDIVLDEESAPCP